MSAFKKLRDISKRYGCDATARFAIIRALNKLVHFECLEILTIDVDDAERSFPGSGVGLSCRWVDLEQLRTLAAADASLQITEEFLDDALRKKDRCYGVFFENNLVNYGWFSSRPTAIRDQLMFCFDPAYIYRYKGFTRPEFRGKRLNAIGMSRALSSIAESGTRRIVAYVNSTNFASLRSCYRMGYERRGRVLITRAFGRYRTWASPGCKPLKVHVSVVPPDDDSA
jgi:hypothetical protein